MKQARFSAGLFAFLRELAANNDKLWFAANRERYATLVKEPMLAFIDVFAEHLAAVDPNYLADPRPVGGSMFRIHRDVRFSRDKSPYKTAAAAHFRHRQSSRDVHGCGFYLHLEPGNCFAGAGIWHPDGDTLAKIRAAIDADGKHWEATLRGGIELSGDMLTRVPSGYPADHQYAVDLRRKDFVSLVEIAERQVLAANFPQALASIYRALLPLNVFLCGALELPGGAPR